MKQPSWPEVSGPLGGHASAYRKELSRLGYAPSTASAHMYLMADVSRWLDENEVAPEAFSSARANQFLAARRAAGQHRRLSPRGLIPLLGYLQAAGVLSEEAEEEPASPTDRLVKEFGGYLATERGLAPRTIVGYERVARRFLLDCASDTSAKDWNVADLDAGQVNVFLLKDTARLSVGSANNVTTALRALLRFFYVRGFSSTSLSGCVPRGGNWRDSGRAVDLTSDDVSRLLAGCDRRTAIGRRDFAILTVLSRLGLRASEVVDLTLDDLDWTLGEVTISGKGGRRDQLPLPVDVGRALADYCRRGRPPTTHRVLFLHGRAPYGPLSYHAIGQIVMAACRRAGLPEVRGHRLRHASACSMRRAGAPLLEIGQVLRHRWAATTALYAKDDLEALAGLARPWPVVVMTSRQQAAIDYLAVRRALGFKLHGHDRLLVDFLDFLEQSGATTITCAAALAWATGRPNASPTQWAHRLSVVRGFARHLQCLDPAVEVPPADLLSRPRYHPAAHLYSEADITRLLEVAAALRPALRGATYQPLLGLLSVTGMRIGEAIGLDRENVDLQSGVLHIPLTKFRKHRRLPLHESTCAALRAYAQVRDEHCPHPKAPSFFVSIRGTRLLDVTVHHVFRKLLTEIGLEPQPDGTGPKVHGLRHTFAVATVRDWHREGADPTGKLSLLSAYLGHADPAYTYWYLQACPELLGLAAERLERWQEQPR